MGRRKYLVEYIRDAFVAARKMSFESISSLLARITSSSNTGSNVADIQQSTANIARKICFLSCDFTSWSGTFASPIIRLYTFSILASSRRAWNDFTTAKHQCQQSTVLDGLFRRTIFQMISNWGCRSSSKQLSKWRQNAIIPGHSDANSADNPKSNSIAWVRRAAASWRRYQSDSVGDTTRSG